MPYFDGSLELIFHKFTVFVILHRHKAYNITYSCVSSEIMYIFIEYANNMREKHGPNQSG